ncbi:MAG: isoprenyl transferase [Selenomonadaceae bacterium]|nr:isoprenyl transferase [Selenomonadaceae bacterium]
MLKKIFGRDDFPVPDRSSPLFRNINWERLPKHVAVIMDGNGRWATQQGMLRTAGHSTGVSALKNILKTASGMKLNALTVYAFSTENWKRPHTEVDFLMKLFSESLMRELEEMHEYKVQIHFIGRIEGLPKSLQKEMRAAEKLMENNTGVKFNVAVNYGGQDELLRVMQNFAQKAKNGELNPEDINESMIEDALDTCGNYPVDLVIRTSGDQRLSNFLLWQSAYAELWFTDTNWPDFTPEEFVEAIEDFGKRERRFGGLNK